MLTAFGACAVTFMMVMYALERRHDGFVLAFALGCALSSTYGFLAGTWPFGVVEAIWALVAVNRFRRYRVARTDRLERVPS
jgi:dolichyl-phosphate-mannose--protein O-mannosyl transferase